MYFEYYNNPFHLIASKMRKKYSGRMLIVENTRYNKDKNICSADILAVSKFSVEKLLKTYGGIVKYQNVLSNDDLVKLLVYRFCSDDDNVKNYAGFLYNRINYLLDRTFCFDASFIVKLHDVLLRMLDESVIELNYLLSVTNAQKTLCYHGDLCEVKNASDELHKLNINFDLLSSGFNSLEKEEDEISDWVDGLLEGDILGKWFKEIPMLPNVS